MIAKIIALIAHEIRSAYRELDKDDKDEEILPEALKLSVTSLITEVIEKREEAEKSKSVPRMGFKSAGSHGDKRDTEGTKD